MLHRAIQLTVYAHEWYWTSVWDCDRNRNRPCVLYKELPKVYLLHNFYKKYESQLTEFESYAIWEAVIRVLGCPITYNGTLGLFLSWESRYQAVRRCFTDIKKKKVKRRKYWRPHVGGKWEKKWEPTPEVAEEKRQAREHKQEWRERKGKDREFRRGRHPRGPRRFYKQARSRTHRAWNKHHIRNGSWDSLYQRDRELFFDWRIWS